MEEVCEEINDEKLSALLQKVNFCSEDLGVYQIKIIISYICSNYQIESNIIRNRRKILEVSDDGTRLLPARELALFSYALDKDKNTHEAICYQLMLKWLNDNVFDIETIVKPLLEAFFSSPWAFTAQL